MYSQHTAPNPHTASLWAVLWSSYSVGYICLQSKQAKHLIFIYFNILTFYLFISYKNSTVWTNLLQDTENLQHHIYKEMSLKIENDEIWPLTWHLVICVLDFSQNLLLVKMQTIK